MRYGWRCVDYPKIRDGHPRGEEEEIAGLDTSELGMEAYPEFSKG